MKLYVLRSQAAPYIYVATLTDQLPHEAFLNEAQIRALGLEA